MPYRTVWFSGIGRLLVCGAILAEVAQASETPIRPGDKVVTTAEAAVQVGARTLATVPLNTELLVTAVKDQWVAVTIQRDGKDVSGWVDRKHLATRGQAADELAAKPPAHEAGGGQQFVLAELKPTLRGHQNRAFVEMNTVGTPGKPTLTFWKKDEPGFRLVFRQGGRLWGENASVGMEWNAEAMETDKVLRGRAHLSIEDDEFVGNLDFDGSQYTFLGEVRLMGHLFKSNKEKPLVFKLVKDQGFVYVAGEGAVVTKEGQATVLPDKPYREPEEKPRPPAPPRGDPLPVGFVGTWVAREPTAGKIVVEKTSIAWERGGKKDWVLFGGYQVPEKGRKISFSIEEATSVADLLTKEPPKRSLDAELSLEGKNLKLSLSTVETRVSPTGPLVVRRPAGIFLYERQ